MKRNIIHTFWMAALPLAIISCSQEELPSEPSEGGVRPLSITVTDGGYAASGGQTKATENGYRTEFTAGDEVGLYIVRDGALVYDNVKLTATAGADGSLTWQPEAGTELGGGLDDESYYLYYPYRTETSPVNTGLQGADNFFYQVVVNWRPESDQSTYAAYTASDLMIADGTVTSDGSSLKLHFNMRHKMAMAVIEMPKTVYKFTDAAIPDYTVASSADFSSSAVKPCCIAPGTYRYIFFPITGTAAIITGSYADGSREFTITPDIDGGSCKTYRVDPTKPVEKSYSLQVGDYFCRNSVGLWYIIPKVEKPGNECIGIVFYVGQHNTDTGDYSQSGIGQQKCHGYVVALTDVNSDSQDRLPWECGPNKEYNRAVGASTDADDWQGYYNCLKIHEFVNNTAGWEMKHFPATHACETYGNRTLDTNGNPTAAYSWQKGLSAPKNTSGWFLPSCGQLKSLYQNRYVLSDRMNDVKNSTPADCIYKDKIKWFSTSLYYWSSTENSSRPFLAWYVNFGSGRSYSDYKDYTRYARPVLAF